MRDLFATDPPADNPSQGSDPLFAPDPSTLPPPRPPFRALRRLAALVIVLAVALGLGLVLLPEILSAPSVRNAAVALYNSRHPGAALAVESWQLRWRGACEFKNIRCDGTMSAGSFRASVGRLELPGGLLRLLREHDLGEAVAVAPRLDFTPSPAAANGIPASPAPASPKRLSRAAEVVQNLRGTLKIEQGAVVLHADSAGAAMAALPGANGALSGSIVFDGAANPVALRLALPEDGPGSRNAAALAAALPPLWQCLGLCPPTNGVPRGVELRAAVESLPVTSLPLPFSEEGVTCPAGTAGVRLEVSATTNGLFSATCSAKLRDAAFGGPALRGDTVRWPEASLEVAIERRPGALVVSDFAFSSPFGALAAEGSLSFDGETAAGPRSIPVSGSVDFAEIARQLPKFLALPADLRIGDATARVSGLLVAEEGASYRLACTLAGNRCDVSYKDRALRTARPWEAGVEIALDSSLRRRSYEGHVRGEAIDASFNGDEESFGFAATADLSGFADSVELPERVAHYVRIPRALTCNGTWRRGSDKDAVRGRIALSSGAGSISADVALEEMPHARRLTFISGDATVIVGPEGVVSPGLFDRWIPTLHPALAGAGIGGNGRVALALDGLSLLQESGAVRAAGVNGTLRLKGVPLKPNDMLSRLGRIMVGPAAADTVALRLDVAFDAGRPATSVPELVFGEYAVRLVTAVAANGDSTAYVDIPVTPMLVGADVYPRVKGRILRSRVIQTASGPALEYDSLAEAVRALRRSDHRPQ